MRLEVIVLQRVRGIDAAAVVAGSDDDERLIEIDGQPPPVLALPIAGEDERIGEGENLLFFDRPATTSELVRSDARAAQQLLHLVAGKLGFAVEDAQKLPRDRLCCDRRRLR